MTDAEELFVDRHSVILECAKAVCSDCRKKKAIVGDGIGERRYFHQSGKNPTDGYVLCNAYALWNLPDSGVVAYKLEKVKR